MRSAYEKLLMFAIALHGYASAAAHVRFLQEDELVGLGNLTEAESGIEGEVRQTVESDGQVTGESFAPCIISPEFLRQLVDGAKFCLWYCRVGVRKLGPMWAQVQVVSFSS